MPAVMERSCACKAEPEPGAKCFCSSIDVTSEEPICIQCTKGQHKILRFPKF